MLWLAGLVGVVAVGAASFFMVDFSDPMAEDEFEDFVEPEVEPGEIPLVNFLSDAGVGEDTPAPLAQTTDALAPPTEDEFVLRAATPDPMHGLTSAEAAIELPEFMQTPQDMTGPDRTDTVEISDWVTPGNAAQIADFDGAEDDLVLVWNDAGASEPSLSLKTDDTDPDLVNVMLDDTAVAQVPAGSGLTVDHIALIPLSAATAVGWAA